ncbi:MAG: DUF1501 domain-containing protein [Candidatus Kapaibacterium sp.]
MKRRAFLQKSAASTLTIATLPALFGNVSVEALANSPELQAASTLAEDSDRIIVLIQLNGGNDGLNTVIPIEDPLYYDARKSIAVKKNESLKINDTIGLHPALAGLKNLYDNGQMSIVHSVTYPNPNRSHFRGTDIWMTATDEDVFKSTGWVGRYLEGIIPTDFPNSMPEHPLAVQIGTSLSLTFQSGKGAAGITFRSPEEFYNLVRDSQGGSSGNGDYPDTPAGKELAFINSIQRTAQTYSGIIKKAGDTGEKEYTAKSKVPYPETDLARRLKIVAQLIAGGLKTRFYLVSIGGFDTHIQQGGATGFHAQLLSELSGAVTAFMADIDKLGHAERVAGLTFSEFGRRVRENGSTGTDHGAAAPLFVFGKSVKGGQMFGNIPSLKPEDLDSRGDITMQFDYRQVYAAALLQWFGTNANTVKSILLDKDFAALPLFASPSSVYESIPFGNAGLFVSECSPNLTASVTSVTCAVPNTMQVRLSVCDIKGNMLMSIFQGELQAGAYRFDIDCHKMIQGNYFVRFDAKQYTDVKKLTIIR